MRNKSKESGVVNLINSTFAGCPITGEEMREPTSAFLETSVREFILRKFFNFYENL